LQTITAKCVVRNYARHWAAFRQPPSGSPKWVSGDYEPAQYSTRNGYEKPRRADEEQSRELMHGHYASISYIDAQVGRILEALKVRNLYENTLVVLTSDHGFHDGEHGYWGKHNLWDASLSVPLLIRLAGGHHDSITSDKAIGSHVTALTEHVDIYPTLCDLCGLAKPDWLEGDSLLPLIEDPGRPWKQAVFAHRKHMWHDRLKVYDIAHTVRTGRYRYSEYLDGKGEVLYKELFDYREDPLEEENRAERPEYACIIEELTGMIKRGWQAFRPKN